MARTKSKRRTGKALHSRAAVRQSPDAPADDIALLALTAAFNVIYREYDRLRDQWREAIAAADADPEHPPLPLTPGGPTDRAVREKHGVDILYDAVNLFSERAGSAARDIFATPAVTLAGALAKLHIVRLAYGTGGGGGDDALEAHQDCDDWLGSAIAELAAIAAE